MRKRCSNLLARIRPSSRALYVGLACAALLGAPLAHARVVTVTLTIPNATVEPDIETAGGTSLGSPFEASLTVRASADVAQLHEAGRGVGFNAPIAFTIAGLGSGVITGSNPFISADTSAPGIGTMTFMWGLPFFPVNVHAS